MPAARRVRVSKFINESDFRAALQERIQIHFIEHMAPILDLFAENNLEAIQKRLGFQTAMGLHDPNNDISALKKTGARGKEHFVGFADAWSGAKKHLETPTAFIFAARRFKQRVGRWPSFRLCFRHSP
jgi:hypothetical protein